MDKTTENRKNPESCKLLICIPVYNNSKTIRAVADSALATGLDVLVVNDGSTDGTEEKLSEAGCFRLDFPENRGKGAALKAAGQWAADKGYSHIITMDADGQHHAEDIPAFLEAVKEQPQALIIGSRDFEAADAPPVSRFGRKFSNFWIWATSGRTVPDSQSGFRAYPCPVMNQLRIRAGRYNFEIEIIVRAIWAGITVSDIPISVTYSEETKASSHFRPFVDNARISLSYTRLLFRRFLPIPKRKVRF